MFAVGWQKLARMEIRRRANVTLVCVRYGELRFPVLSRTPILRVNECTLNIDIKVPENYLVLLTFR